MRRDDIIKHLPHVKIGYLMRELWVFWIFICAVNALQTLGDSRCAVELFILQCNCGCDASIEFLGACYYWLRIITCWWHAGLALLVAFTTETFLLIVGARHSSPQLELVTISHSPPVHVPHSLQLELLTIPRPGAEFSWSSDYLRVACNWSWLGVPLWAAMLGVTVSLCKQPWPDKTEIILKSGHETKLIQIFVNIKIMFVMVYCCIVRLFWPLLIQTQFTNCI